MVGYAESTISFAIQIVVLGLLFGAVFLKYKQKYRQHGIAMLSAVILHWISILTVMIPSSAAFYGTPASMDFSDPWVTITLVHVLSGVTAALLGTWLVGSWHLKADVKSCFRKKRVMDVTFGLWTLALVLGFVLYLAIIQVI